MFYVHCADMTGEQYVVEFEQLENTVQFVIENAGEVSQVIEGAPVSVDNLLERFNGYGV